MMRRDDSFDEGLIHLVDYDTASLVYLFEELTLAGYRVLPSSVSRKALESIRETKPEIVFWNLHMPGIDSLELLAEVRQVSPSTRVILMSSCGDWAVYEEALRLGAFDMVPKPVTAIVLRKILDRVGVRRKGAVGQPKPFN